MDALVSLAPVTMEDACRFGGVTARPGVIIGAYGGIRFRHA